MIVWLLTQRDDFWTDDAGPINGIKVLGAYADPVDAMMDADEMEDIPWHVNNPMTNWQQMADWTGEDGFSRCTQIYERYVYVQPVIVHLNDSAEMTHS